MLNHIDPKKPADSLALMMAQVPDGNLKDGLERAKQGMVLNIQRKRAFLLCLVEDAMLCGAQQMEFSLNVLPDPVKQLADVFEVHFLAPKEFWAEIRPVAEIIFMADLESEEFIEEFTGQSESAIASGISDFVLYGYNFHLWSNRTNFSKVFSGKGLGKTRMTEIELKYDGGLADMHRMDAEILLHHTLEKLRVQNALAEQIGYQKFHFPSRVFKAADDAEYQQTMAASGSFKVLLEVNEDWLEIMAMENTLMKKASEGLHRDASQLLEQYGAKTIGHLLKTLTHVSNGGLGVSSSTAGRRESLDFSFEPEKVEISRDFLARISKPLQIDKLKDVGFWITGRVASTRLAGNHISIEEMDESDLKQVGLPVGKKLSIRLQNDILFSDLRTGSKYKFFIEGVERTDGKKRELKVTKIDFKTHR